jgi:hypothetical protein
MALSATAASDGAPDPPLEPSLLWRVRRGPIGQVNAQAEPLPQQVDGVVVARTGIVLRTDNVVVEALLGQARRDQAGNTVRSTGPPRRSARRQSPLFAWPKRTTFESVIASSSSSSSPTV